MSIQIAQEQQREYGSPVSITNLLVALLYFGKIKCPLVHNTGVQRVLLRTALQTKLYKSKQ